jgi:hypothetical protein
MPDFADQEYGSIKAFITTLWELEDLFIEACREGISNDFSSDAKAVIADQLHDPEDSRQATYNSKFPISDMLQSLVKTSNFKPIWQSVMKKILELCFLATCNKWVL